MAKINNRLAENLESQVEMHEILLEVLEQENQLPASCDLFKLEEIQSMRDSTVVRISELETLRIQIVEEYRRENGIKMPITLSDILANCEDDARLPMSNSRNLLNNLIEKIRDTGKQNAVKANARITCFNEVQKAVHKSFNRHSIYSMDGMIEKPKGACLMQKSI